MDTQLLISGVIFGLSIGSIFFLMAIGLSLCFGLMRIISLDQLLYYSIGAYITYSLSLATGSVWLGVLGGLVVAGIAAFAVERLIFRRIYERELTFSMITSFGILIGGIGVIKFFWGVVPRPVPVPMMTQLDIARHGSPGLPPDRRRHRRSRLCRHLALPEPHHHRQGDPRRHRERGARGRPGHQRVPSVHHHLHHRRHALRAGRRTACAADHGGSLRWGSRCWRSCSWSSSSAAWAASRERLISAFIVGQVVSLGSLIYAPLAQMAPFAIMLLILLIKPTGLYGSALLKR